MKQTNIAITSLHPFAGNPYQVRDDAEMEALIESIREYGIYTPLIVRPMDGQENEYEVISGHRRLHAAKKAGLSEVPALLYTLDRDAAAIAVVDSNLHREHILPSEKAFAYKLKMDVLKKQGKRTDLTSSQIATKFNAAAQVGADTGESRDQVYRYIRLTNLIPPLLKLVDKGRIAFSVAVELSYLHQSTQEHIAEIYDRDEATPSYSQACRMHKYEREGLLDAAFIQAVMNEEKANQKPRLKIPMERVRKYFPQSYSAAQIEDTIVKLCERDYRRRVDRER
jgi:ParB family chromosome partitioning protein